MSRRPHAPSDADRTLVQSLAAYGVQQEEIAGLVGVAEKTLRKHYRKELDTAALMANAKVAQNLYRMATGTGKESVAAAIFWLKCRAHWKPIEGREHTGTVNVRRIVFGARDA